jgi:hypothetical protein
MIERPLLKYSAHTQTKPGVLEIHYRRRVHTYATDAPEAARAALALCDGRTPAETIISNSGVEARLFGNLVEWLEHASVMLDGGEVLREDGNLGGREMFWRLEAMLFDWRYRSPVQTYQSRLDWQIATGKAPPGVVKGFCLELGYLLRNVPDELALAVVHSPDEQIRSLFMDFYDEESRHGEILFGALKTWFDHPEQILYATPLPATVGLLNTYRAWAIKDPLLYATALMRDESSRLDLDIPDDENIYRGMRLHYEVPAEVVDKFEWHANLDRNCEHGFFPEKVFSQYEVISRSRARLLTSALKQIIELHDLFKWNVSAYYCEHDVASRLGLYETLERRVDAQFI